MSKLSNLKKKPAETKRAAPKTPNQDYMKGYLEGRHGNQNPVNITGSKAFADGYLDGVVAYYIQTRTEPPEKYRSEVLKVKQSLNM